MVMKNKLRECQELQELVENIIITAKLIGYHMVQENDKIYFYINDNIIPYIGIELIIWNNHMSTLYTSAEEDTMSNVFYRESHNVKVNHLKKLMRSL